jgi:hypothetical protein
MNLSFLLIIPIIFLSSCDDSDSEGFPVDAGGEIRVYSNNPWYWEYRGEPVILIGGSFEDNMYQFPNGYYGHNDPLLSSGMTDMDLREHLDRMVEAGANYIRGSMSSRNHGNRFPYRKISGVPGDNFNDSDLYDLDQWDQEWENRLSTFLRMAYERGIIVSLELFDRFDLFVAEAEHEQAEYRGNRNTGWLHHPWNPDRNINYTSEQSGLPAGRIDDMGYDHELFYSVPGLSGHDKSPEPIVLQTLQRYVDKVLSYTFQYDNIIYIIENETYQPIEFGNYWVDYINNKAAAIGKNVFVTNMVGEPEFDNPRQESIRRDSRFTFYDYSQNNHNYGQEHYDNILAVRDDIKNNAAAKPMNSIKIYGGYNYTVGIEEGKRRFFRGIFAGNASARFHRPGYNRLHFGIGFNEDAQAWIRSMRMMLDDMNIFVTEPRNDLLSNRSTDEAYCLAQEGRQYAVYFTNGGSVDLDMSTASGPFILRWLNISESRWSEPVIVAGGNYHSLAPPSSGQWVVLILQEE